MVFLQNVWWFLVLIGVMILLHELGHFAVARLFDVKVETFSFGFGPRLFGFKHGETDFRFSALPILGGYVKMAGDQPGEEASDPRSLIAKPRWQRLLITLAGPAVNMILAVVLLTGLFMEHYPKVPTPPDPAVISGSRWRRGQGRHSGGRPRRAGGRYHRSELGRHRHEGDGQRRTAHAGLGSARRPAAALHHRPHARSKGRNRRGGMGPADRGSGGQRRAGNGSPAGGTSARRSSAEGQRPAAAVGLAAI